MGRSVAWAALAAALLALLAARLCGGPFASVGRGPAGDEGAAPPAAVGALRATPAELAALVAPSPAFCERVRVRGTPVACAHGGDPDAGPPNSVAALVGAARAGHSCVEVDASVSRDGVAFAAHPLDVKRLLRASGRSELEPGSLLASEIASLRWPRWGGGFATLESALVAVRRSAAEAGAAAPNVTVDLKIPIEVRYARLLGGGTVIERREGGAERSEAAQAAGSCPGPSAPVFSLLLDGEGSPQLRRARGPRRAFGDRFGFSRSSGVLRASAPSRAPGRLVSGARPSQAPSPSYERRCLSLARSVANAVAAAGCDRCVAWAKRDALAILYASEARAAWERAAVLPARPPASAPAMGYVHAPGDPPLSRLLALPRPHMVGIELHLAIDDAIDFVRSDLGALTYVWTVEDARAAADALEGGADVLVTSAPDAVRDAIEERVRRCERLSS